MPNDIHQAINEVMKQVGYVQKQRTGGLNYSFAGEAALIEAVRPAMVEAGIYCAVIGLKDIHRGEYTTAKGSVMQTVDLTAVVRFTHALSATSIDVEALGSGADMGDKASNKALTGAYKYALRQTFCIQTGDDADASPSQPRAGKQAVKPQADPQTGEIKPPNGKAAPTETPEQREQRMAVTRAAFGNPDAPDLKAQAATHATIHLHSEDKNWRQAIAAFVTRYPAYQIIVKGKPTGEPNIKHILGAAAKVGFSDVNDSNWGTVLELIDKRAAELEPQAA